jgi:membrane AbrB-like protein
VTEEPGRRAFARASVWGALILLSLALAFGLYETGLPAAFLIGPMIAAIAVAVAGGRMKIARWAFAGAQAIIGCLVARALTGTILVTLAQSWAPMLLVVVATIAAGAAVGWVLTRFRVLPGTTAAWGSTPGAATVMVAMAAEYGADVRLVGFMQYLRIVVVVLTASLVAHLLLGASAPQATEIVPAGIFAVGGPFAVPPLELAETLAVALIGGLLGHYLPLPGAGVLVPMALGVLVHTTGLVAITLPSWLLAATYAVLGWYIGLGFNRDVLTYVVRAIPKLLLATALLIGLCALSAWMLTGLLGIDPLTAYLATSPGGLDSVAIIAIAGHADIPFVLAVQTLRLFAVILTGPQIAKLIVRVTR